MKNAFLDRLRDKKALQALGLGIAYWLALLISLELLLHISAFGAPDGRFLLTVGFSAVFACGLALVLSFLPGKANFIGTALVTLFFILLYASQMIYHFVFGTLYSLANIQQGGDAITTFWRDILLTVTANAHWFVLLLLLFVPMFLLRRHFRPSNWVWRAALVAVAVAVQLITTACLGLGGTGIFSNHYFYTSELTTTDQATERFGLLTALRLNLAGTTEADSTDEPEDYYVPPTTQPTVPTGEEAPPEYGKNVLDINFNELSAMTENEKLAALDAYCATLTGTSKNQYTGLLRDYNLIVLCAEAFSPAAIQPDITPTLYKLSQQGIIFNNYYNTFPNNTTDGEYALCMGQYPDFSRSKEQASFLGTYKHSLPYCLGNIFKAQRGVQCYGYHNYRGYYYNRAFTHPNMGYKMKFAGAGMTFTTGWPTSDLEMMQQSVDDYIGQDQFHAYYMTFSGHMSYNRKTNPIAARNYALVKDLELGEQAKCYLSCHIELDKALEYLLQRLEEAGVADRTAIVIAGDHYPYGITDNKQYAQLVGYEPDSFNKHRSSLLFWVGGMEENIYVDEYCCNVDILPTLLNLWGFDFDSRLLAGTDVFSDGEHMAVLTDGSVFTDKLWLLASSGELRYQVDEKELPADYAENLIKLVKTKMAVSKSILDLDYYSHVFTPEFIGEVSTEPVLPTETTAPPTEPPETTAVTEPAETVSPTDGDEQNQ